MLKPLWAFLTEIIIFGAKTNTQTQEAFSTGLKEN